MQKDSTPLEKTRKNLRSIGKKTASVKKKSAEQKKVDSVTMQGKELAIVKTEKQMLEGKTKGEDYENHIVPLEPTQSYIVRDFLRTNNIFNQSMKVLSEQTQSLVRQYEKEGNASIKSDKIQMAASEVRASALALAQIVQAKVNYIKVVRDMSLPSKQTRKKDSDAK